MKWTKFKDEIPKSYYIYVTDWVSTWIDSTVCSWTVFAKNNLEYGWAEIPKVEVPIHPKELHWCRHGKFLCYEEFDVGGIFLLLLTCNDEVVMIVNYCPFCGYAIKGKK